VHWHLGSEHLSVGEYDELGTGPDNGMEATTRQGFQCRHYNVDDPRFTRPYDWKYCKDMVVGQTYEVHWPHSSAGACRTPWQYQTPFYDGVFCTDGVISLETTARQIGVQSQVFTIVNDESFYYSNLFDGMISDGVKGQDIAKYTGSTTGTSRNNEVCSPFTAITWQVDRVCHMISASSFDKLCMDMLAQADDMHDDVHPHGARELVADEHAADNHQSRRQRRHLTSAGGLRNQN
jgi:Delta carbonic anhydrase